MLSTSSRLEPSPPNLSGLEFSAPATNFQEATAAQARNSPPTLPALPTSHQEFMQVSQLGEQLVSGVDEISRKFNI